MATIRLRDETKFINFLCTVIAFKWLKIYAVANYFLTIFSFFADVISNGAHAAPHKRFLVLIINHKMFKQVSVTTVKQ